MFEAAVAPQAHAYPQREEYPSGLIPPPKLPIQDQDQQAGHCDLFRFICQVPALKELVFSPYDPREAFRGLFIPMSASCNTFMKGFNVRMTVTLVNGTRK